jgi:8-oxo-dGTP pyrophosphatase MutT (NUDIX family)
MGFRPDLAECWVFRIGSRGLEVLLIHRAPGRIFAGLWQPVTGAIEPDERVPLAALREVGEETGFGRDAIEAAYDLDQIAPFYDEGADAIVVSAIFAVRVAPDAEPTLSHEHDGYAWLAPDEALERAVWPAYDDSIRRIRDHILDPAQAPWFELTPDWRRRRR